MAKRIIKASDKVLTRFSAKDGLENINLSSNKVTNISNKIQDVVLETKRKSSNFNFKKISINGHSNIYKRKTRDFTKYNKSSTEIKEDLTKQFEYDKENLDNTFEQASFRNTEKNIRRSASDITKKTTVNKHTNSSKHTKLIKKGAKSLYNKKFDKYVDNPKSVKLRKKKYHTSNKTLGTSLKFKKDEKTSKLSKTNSAKKTLAVNNSFKKKNKKKNLQYKRLKFDDEDKLSAKFKVNNEIKYSGKLMYRDVFNKIKNRKVRLGDLAVAKSKINEHFVNVKTLNNDIYNSATQDITSDTLSLFQSKTKKTAFKTSSLITKSVKDHIQSKNRRALRFSPSANIEEIKKIKKKKKYQKKKNKNKIFSIKNLSNHKKENEKNIKDTIRKFANGTFKAVQTVALSLALPILILICALLMVIIMIVMIIGFAEPMSYTYTANDIDVTEVENYFYQRELDYKIKIDNPPQGFDKYVNKIDPIGHIPEELLAYFSVTYYEDGFEYTNELKKEIDEIFDEMYQFRRWVETKVVGSGKNKRTIRILHTELDSKPLNDVLTNHIPKEKLRDYKEFINLKGCYDVLSNPLSHDYKGITSKPYGWQTSLNEPDTMDFYNALDLSTSQGEPVKAMIDGYVSYGSDSKLGDYVSITTAGEGYSVRYYGIQTNKDYSQSGDDTFVKQDDEFAKTASYKLTIQVIDSAGNSVNPYFYIYSDVQSLPNNDVYYQESLIPNINTTNATGSAKDVINIATSFTGKNGYEMFKDYITPTTGHGVEEWCADFCATSIALGIGGSIRGNQILDKDGNPFMNWAAGVSLWKNYANDNGLLHSIDSGYAPKAGDIILQDGVHMEIIVSTEPFTTVSGNSGQGNGPGSRKVSYNTFYNSPQHWANYRNNKGCYIISVPYTD